MSYGGLYMDMYGQRRAGFSDITMHKGFSLTTEVTFISPCPAKGLAIVLRLALMSPGWFEWNIQLVPSRPTEDRILIGTDANPKKDRHFTENELERMWPSRSWGCYSWKAVGIEHATPNGLQWTCFLHVQTSGWSWGFESKCDPQVRGHNEEPWTLDQDMWASSNLLHARGFQRWSSCVLALAGLRRYTRFSCSLSDNDWDCLCLGPSFQDLCGKPSSKPFLIHHLDQVGSIYNYLDPFVGL